MTPGGAAQWWWCAACSPSPGAPRGRRTSADPTPATHGWQYQLQGRVDTGVEAATFIVDGFDVDAATVADLRGRGRTVICYVNGGALEDWRPDADRYPDEIVGDPLDDWEGERWIDIRATDVLRPILAERFDIVPARDSPASRPTTSTATPRTPVST